MHLSRLVAVSIEEVAFIGYDDRLAHIYGRIKPGFAKLRGEPALAGYRLPPSV